MNRTRKRMIFDMLPHIQMAIRLRAVKDQCTTTAVLERAVAFAFEDDVAEAMRVLRAIETTKKDLKKIK